MEPTITSGSFVLTFCFNNYNINDLIVLSVNEKYHIVKRIIAKKNKKYQIAGDNKSISSSFCDYTYSPENIEGRVILIFNPTLIFSKFVKNVKNLIKYNRKYANGNN